MGVFVKLTYAYGNLTWPQFKICRDCIVRTQMLCCTYQFTVINTPVVHRHCAIKIPVLKSSQTTFLHGSTTRHPNGFKEDSTLRHTALTWAMFSSHTMLTLILIDT